MTSRDSALWDVEAETFDEEPDHGLRDPDVRAAWRRLLVSVIPPVPSRVADLGCGTGSLSLLLAEEGHRVDGVDFSPQMIRRAAAKAGSFPGTGFAVGDAAAPDLPPASYDVVMCRHVLWALSSPAEALARWVDLLTPDGRLVLVEGNWSTGTGLTGLTGLTGEQTVSLVEGAGLAPTLRPLPEMVYWGKQIEDERYLVVGRRRA